MDWDPSDLLDGLDDAARGARLRLLEHLDEQGVPEEELRRACAEDRLLLLPIERALFSPARLTAAQLADAAGLPAEWMRRARRAMGLSEPGPDEAAYGEEDVEAARRLRRYLDGGLSPEDVLANARVLGASLARSAETVRAVAARALLEPGIGEDELARRYAAAAERLMPLVEADLAYLLRLHMRELIRQDAISHAELSTGELQRTEEMGVGFADLVGFTALGEESDVEALGDVATLLVERTEEVLDGPVRLVKSIGDAVMLVSSDPRALVDAALGLLAAVEGDERLPPLRCGVAVGPVLQRFGDVYGGTVNVAARLCSRARPGSVLVAGAVHDALAGTDALDWSRAGSKRLKGVGAVETWRVRRTPAS